MSAGVGGGAGLVRVRAVVVDEDLAVGAGWVAGAPGGGEEGEMIEGGKGSLVMSGKEEV